MWRIGMPPHDLDAFLAKRVANRADALDGSPRHQEHGPSRHRLDAQPLASGDIAQLARGTGSGERRVMRWLGG